MNPLTVLFFIAMFLDDYLFRQGKYLKMYLYSILFYCIFYYFNNRSTFHSYTKKYNMAAFSQSFDSTVYARVKYNLKTVRKFLEEYWKKCGKKVSLTAFWIKVVGEVYKVVPEANESIRFGLKGTRKSVDIGVLVNVHNKDLANLTIRNVPGKTLEEIYDELKEEGDVFRREKNKEYNKSKGVLKLIPSFLISICLEVTGILSAAGFHIPSIGLNRNHFGSVLLSYVGSYGLKNVYGPLCPFTQTSGVFTVCALETKHEINKEGKVEESEYLPVNFTLDHRYVDGMLSTKMVKKSKELFADPKSFDVI